MQLIWLLLASFTLLAEVQKPNFEKIAVTEVKPLIFEKPLQEGRGAFVSAASGLVEINDTFYAVADDDQALFHVDLKNTYTSAIPLSNIPLSSDPKIRKSEKPDYEALLLLPAAVWPPQGALIAWPSASKKNRVTAVLTPVNSLTKMDDKITFHIDNLVKTLEKQVKDINIEGIFIDGKDVCLIQRGNSKKSKSGIFRFSLAEIINAIHSGKWPKTSNFKSFDIGELDGVKLSLTDGTSSKYGIIAIAAAEATDTALADGQIMGSVLVQVKDNKPIVLGRLDLVKKFEGIVVKETSEGLDVYLVDDADDPKLKSSLFKTNLKRAQLL